MRSPQRLASLTIAAVAVSAALVAPVSARSAARYQYPNLVPRQPFEVGISRADPGTGERALRLSVAVQNLGDYAFDLLGVPDGRTDSADAQQCVGWAAPRACTERRPVGKFVWHPDHRHYHFEGFASYELRRIRAGRPDMRPGGLVAGGTKVSFCLIDYEPNDESSFPAPWPLYYSCFTGAGFQGISAGWSDVYTRDLDGQQIVVDGVPAGTYALIVRIDPDDRLYESSESDNLVASKVALSAESATVLCHYDAALSRCASLRG